MLDCQQRGEKTEESGRAIPRQEAMGERQPGGTVEVDEGSYPETLAEKEKPGVMGQSDEAATGAKLTKTERRERARKAAQGSGAVPSRARGRHLADCAVARGARGDGPGARARETGATGPGTTDARGDSPMVHRGIRHRGRSRRENPARGARNGVAMSTALIRPAPMTRQHGGRRRRPAGRAQRLGAHVLRRTEPRGN